MLSCVLPADVNECEAEPCKNGGICTDLVANYSCECPGEFMGRNCQQSKYCHRFTSLFQKKKKLLFSLTETTTEYCRNI